MSKYVVMAGWDDVPHLDEQTKQDLYASIPPYQRDARSKGIPQLGSGAIYPVPESEIVCKPFEIARYWPRCYALDVGWNRTAAVWGAWNLDEDKVFLYAEHYPRPRALQARRSLERCRGRETCAAFRASPVTLTVTS